MIEILVGQRRPLRMPSYWDDGTVIHFSLPADPDELRAVRELVEARPLSGETVQSLFQHPHRNWPRRTWTIIHPDSVSPNDGTSSP
jgi:hypothetical protein